MLRLRMMGFKPIHLSVKSGFNPINVSLKSKVTKGIKYINGKPKLMDIGGPLRSANNSVSSVYYISPDGKTLARISNHWSDSNISGVKTCGNIKDCWWRLIGKQGSSTNKSFQVGFTDFEKLQNTGLNTGELKYYGNKLDRMFFGDTLQIGKL